MERAMILHSQSITDFKKHFNTTTTESMAKKIHKREPSKSKELKVNGA